MDNIIKFKINYLKMDEYKSKRYQDWSEKKYLITCDLDGTLLNNDSILSTNTINFLQHISSLGHIVCLITGRPVQGSIKFYNELKLNTVLCNLNGAYISNPSDETFIPFAIPFSRKLILSLLENQNLLKYINVCLIEGVNKGWLLKINNHSNENYFTNMKELFHLNDRDIKTINLDDLNILDTDIVGVLFHINNTNNINSIIYEVKKIAPTLIVRIWNLDTDGFVVEINSSFSSKGSALKFLSSYYGIPLEQCIAFGDGDNDVSMLSTAVWGFAMKNASSAAQLSSRFLTKYDNNNDGVVKELKKFLKI